LATVGGQVDDGEAPEACARRELLEETGLVASEMVSLGSYVLNANRGCGVGHLFAALGASHQEDSASGGEPASASSSSALDGGDDLEEMEAMWLTRDELEDAVSANEFKSGTWALTCLLALSRLDRRARVAARPAEAARARRRAPALRGGKYLVISPLLQPRCTTLHIIGKDKVRQAEQGVALRGGKYLITSSLIQPSIQPST
jgi:ADP-ribose pyrophosphatase YjhB (NUDIX family)